MGRKPKRRGRARTRAEGSAKERARSRPKGKRPSPSRTDKVPRLPGFAVAQYDVWPRFTFTDVDIRLPGRLAVQPITGPARARSKTILLVEGTNALTGRPVRIYIRPDDTLIAAETLGQMEYR